MPKTPMALQQAERGLMQTAITQPAMLAMDTAIYKLLGEYGFGPIWSWATRWASMAR